MIDVLVTERGGSVGLEVVNTGSILLSIAASTGVYQLTVNESRDAYQLALAGGYNGSVSEWLGLTTGSLNASLLSGKGYLITASASGTPMGLAPNTSGHALLYDPSQVGGLRWGEVQGAGVGSVTSFNGREDVVTSISGDYQDALITNTSTITGGTVKNALDSVDLRLGSTGALINQVSGELNFYSTGRDTSLTNNLQSTGSNLYGLLVNATGELGTRISNTGSSLFTLNANTSGALNFYLTGGDASLSSRIESTGSSLDSRVNILGTRIENTGSTLFNFANTISGELNNADSALSTRIQNTGSNLYNLIVNESGAFGTRLENTGIALTSLNSSTSGAINFYLTGEDKRLSDRIDNSGSLLINGSGQLDYNITGLAFRLEQTGSATVNTVNSVFGRQGAIVQQSGDYSNTGITNQSNVVGGTTAQALNTLDQRLTASGALGGGGSVTSVFGRAGVVVGQSGDYADTGVTNTSSVDGGSVFHALNSIHSRINNSGGLLINLSGEFDNKLGSTGSILLGFANTVSGELNFYLTGGDSALSTRLGNTGSNLYNLLVNESGSFETRLKNTGDTLISLNSSTSGAINLALTGADATLSNRITNSGNLFINASGELSNRISSTGSTLDSFIRNVSGELNLYYTGADNVLSSRIENTGSSLNTRVNDLETRLGSTGSTLLNLANTISGELNFYSTGRDAVLTNNLQSTGSNLYGMLISATGELKTKIEATGSSLFNLNLSTSGALNFNITGSDAALSLRIEQTGAATQNTVNSVFGRQGSIIQQSGDYANTGITNLSTVIGATTADALNTLSSRLGNTGNLLIGLSGEFNNKIESTGSTLFNFTNTASGELNFYLTGGDSALSARLGNTGSILHGLISNSSGEFNTKIGNTGAALISLNSSTSGAINYYLTGGDAALLTTINNSGSVLHGLIINSSGEFNTKLSSTGTALSSLNSSTSGDINFYLTGGDAELSNRIASTGSTLDLFVRNTSGELNFYLTGGDASLSSRLGSTGSLLPNVTLNSSLTGVLEITGQTIYGKDAGADKIPFWDNSEKRLGYLNAGSGLYITGDVINAAVAISRNCIDNGDFTVWQRGTTLTSAGTFPNSDDAYIADRWYLLSDGNDIVDVDKTQDSPGGLGYCLRLDVETVNKKFGVAQIVESIHCEGLVGQTVTLSFWAKVSSTTKLDTIKAAVVSWTGTADVVTSDIISAWGAEGTNPTLIANATYENTPANLGVTTAWAEYSITCVVDTSGAKNVAAMIWSDVTDTTLGDFLYITDVQLSKSASALPFERLPITTQEARCMRYFELLQGSGINILGTIGNLSYVFWQYKVRKRVNPTFTNVSGIATIDNACADFVGGYRASNYAYIGAGSYSTADL